MGTAEAGAAPVYLSPERLQALRISTAEVADSIEQLIRGRAAGRVWAAPKSVLKPGDGRYVMATVALADDPPCLAVKSLVLNPRNPERGLPQINSLVTLLDSRSGVPLAVMDGNWITAVRTAGLSAVAARRLANPDASVIAFVGCGVQARSHLDAFGEMFPLAEIRAFGRGARNRDALCELAEQRGLKARKPETPREALEGADLVVTSIDITARIEPFLDARWLPEGAFATVTDAAVPWMPDGFEGFDRIVVDDREQEQAMPEPMVPAARVSGDLGELVTGAADGRQAASERCAFMFRGLALGDLAMAALAWQRAREAC